MKKLKIKSIIFCLIFISMFFVGCGNKSTIHSINMTRYFKSDVTATYYQETETGTIDLDKLTNNKLDENYLSKYVQLEITAESSWIYKMYIDYITFYVYTNIDSDKQMILNVSVSNLAEESDLLDNKDTEQVETKTESKEFSFNPSANNAKKFTMEIKKTVATATTASPLIVFDLYKGFQEELFEDSSFSWTIYGLEVYGESRAY